MIDLNEKIFLKKKYFNIFMEHFTEEQYLEYLRAVISYSLYGECTITTPVVYAAFMFTKNDIDRDTRILIRNQENSKYKAGRKKSVTTLEILQAIQNGKITSYKGLKEHFGVCEETIRRRLREIDDAKTRKKVFDILH